LIALKAEDEAVKCWLNIAKNSTNLLKFLVDDTLDYFQIRSGKFQIKKSPVKIPELIDQCFDLITIQMSQKGLQKVIQIDPSLVEVDFMFDR
jgi:signal transduction histidine kinase